MGSPSLPLLALSMTLLACAGNSTETSANAADASVTTPGADSGASDAPPALTDCSLPAMLGPNFASLDASGNGFVDNPLDIEVRADIDATSTLYFASYDAEPVPLGNHEMTDQWLDAECTFCLFINSVNQEAQEQNLWFPISGSINIVSVKDDFKMMGTNLVFQHVQFVGDSLKVEPAPSGCTARIPVLSIDTPMHVGTP